MEVQLHIFLTSALYGSELYTATGTHSAELKSRLQATNIVGKKL